MTGDLAAVLDEEQRIMNGWAPHYDQATLTNAYVYSLERAEFARWVAATVGEAGLDPAALTVLDAGCGTGGVLELLARERFAQLTGFDLSEAMLDEARRRDLPGASWVQGLIEDHPFPSSSFDVIVACFTVHHLLDPSAFFRLVELALRPGGWFFVLEYDGVSAARGDSRPERITRSLGDGARAAFARKNRRALAALPTIPRVFNPAHRLLSEQELVAALASPEHYELRRRSRGALLPTLLPVLVEQSAFDRGLARLVGTVDRRLASRTGGLFQWVAGRRRTSR